MELFVQSDPLLDLYDHHNASEWGTDGGNAGMTNTKWLDEVCPLSWFEQHLERGQVIASTRSADTISKERGRNRHVSSASLKSTRVAGLPDSLTPAGLAHSPMRHNSDPKPDSRLLGVATQDSEVVLRLT